MKQEVTNFSRFYSTFNRMPYHGDRESLKQQLVMQFTNGRTESLREVTVKEYEALFGPYITKVLHNDPKGRWEWIDGPWPWENEGDD